MKRKLFPLQSSNGGGTGTTVGGPSVVVVPLDYQQVSNDETSNFY